MSSATRTYEAPTLTVIGSVVELTKDDLCVWGKTITTTRDTLGYAFNFPIGNCPSGSS